MLAPFLRRKPENRINSTPARFSVVRPSSFCGAASQTVDQLPAAGRGRRDPGHPEGIISTRGSSRNPLDWFSRPADTIRRGSAAFNPRATPAYFALDAEAPRC